MFVLSLIAALIFSTYLLPPLFLLHLLWLFASALLTGRPVTRMFQHMAVVEDDITLPHSPGYFNPHDDLRNLAIPDDIPCILPTSDAVQSAAHKLPMDDVLDSSLSDKVYVVDFFEAPKQISLSDATSENYSSRGSSSVRTFLFIRRRTFSSKLTAPLQRLSSLSRTRLNLISLKTKVPTSNRVSGICRERELDQQPGVPLPKVANSSRKLSFSSSWLRSIKLIYPPEANARLYLREVRV